MENYVTTQMTDPMNALVSFKDALVRGHISPQKGDVHHDLLVLLDRPNGETRFTYALVKDRNVVALTTVIPADPMDGYPCFNAGYAVVPESRSKGYGKEVVRKAFDELTNGFKRAGIPHLYVEAIVSTENQHSNKLAKKMFSENPSACTDSVSGQSAFQYVKQLF
jgi:hypothetical protein